MADQVPTGGAPSKKLFWGCFLALITTAFGFISRMFLIDEWGTEFGLDGATKGELQGMGIWPFAISIVAFSLFIDRIGYKTAMVLSFLGYVVWSAMGVGAYFASAGGDTDLGYRLLYWGSLILGLSNGTVEAYINPVVATMFKENKTKWLNMLHAGWPGGLVIGGLITIGLAYLPVEGGVPWWVKIAIIVPPAVIFFLMLIGEEFPEQERVAAGVSYREMLAEFGVAGASIFSFLVTLQLIQAIPTVPWQVFAGLGVAIVVAFGAYTRSFGNLLLFVLALIMIPLATTEIGTDGWIESIMKGAAEGSFHPGLVLVYTSAIMVVLRFMAGPIVHRISPIGLLICSSILAIAGLYWLSFASGTLIIFAAATLYAFGKTFFWPTMLGIAGEQTPRGGALTLNALGGIGMLAVGVLGFPYIGTLQEAKGIEAVKANTEVIEAAPQLVSDGALTVTEERDIYSIITYDAISDEKLASVLQETPAAERDELQAEIANTRSRSSQGALADMCIFPAVMLVAYIALGLYFKSRGGYQAEVLTGHAAEGEKFTGGVPGPADR